MAAYCWFGCSSDTSCFGVHKYISLVLSISKGSHLKIGTSNFGQVGVAMPMSNLYVFAHSTDKLADLQTKFHIVQAELHMPASLVSMFHCFTVSLFHCFTSLLFHCFTVTLLRCFTVTLFHWFTDSLIHCFTVSLFHCLTVSLFHCTRWWTPSFGVQLGTLQGSTESAEVVNVRSSWGLWTSK